ncbi:hypothetical protein COOONC_17072 [Cooperia oncophora]
MIHRLLHRLGRFLRFFECTSNAWVYLRASDLSSLSSADPNSSISDSSEEAKLQPPAIVRHPRQPYLTRLAREAPVSTSVLQTVFDNIERPELKRFGENNNGKEWMTVPVSVEEDMRRNDSTGWNLIPTTVTTPKPRLPVDVNEEAIQSRKRIVCSQMSESLKAVDNACAQINKVTAPQHWRAPHLLQTNLNTLRDSITTAHDALGTFVDGTGRISIDRKNPKAQGDLCFLLSTYYTAHQICRRLLNGAQLLIQPLRLVIPSAPLAWTEDRYPYVRSSLLPFKANDRSLYKSPPFLDETKRLSSSSTSTVTSSDSSQPSSILVTKHSGDKPKGRVTFADEPRDRPSVAPSHENGESSKAPQMNGSLRFAMPSGPHRLHETRIIEEDDLESNDYAYLDDVVPGRSNAYNNPTNNSISDEDRQLVRFYAPQLDQHTESLSLAIEDFLGTVENNLPPREFVQKGKAGQWLHIILAAHKLIYIGDTVSQCVGDRTASNSLRQCADRLCDLLKQCVAATKLASEEYPELKSMQGMIDSIIAVSKTAQEMKVLVKQWC